jgi:hypothetical protein
VCRKSDDDDDPRRFLPGIRWVIPALVLLVGFSLPRVLPAVLSLSFLVFDELIKPSWRA